MLGRKSGYDSIQRVGTGVVIHNCKEHGAIIITCRHVAEGGVDAVYYYDDLKTPTRIDATIVDLHEDQDLAIVSLFFPLEASVPVGLAFIDTKAQMFAARVMKRREPHLFDQIYWYDQYRVTSKEPIIPGDSGSPIFSFEGKLLGIVFAVSARTSHIGFIVPAEEIRKYADVYLSCKK